METIKDSLTGSIVGFNEDDPEAKALFERMKDKKIGTIRIHLYSVNNNICCYVDKNELRDIEPKTFRRVVLLAAM